MYCTKWTLSNKSPFKRKKKQVGNTQDTKSKCPMTGPWVSSWPTDPLANFVWLWYSDTYSTTQGWGGEKGVFRKPCPSLARKARPVLGFYQLFSLWSCLATPMPDVSSHPQSFWKFLFTQDQPWHFQEREGNTKQLIVKEITILQPGAGEWSSQLLPSTAHHVHKVKGSLFGEGIKIPHLCPRTGSNPIQKTF